MSIGVHRRKVEHSQVVLSAKDLRDIVTAAAKRPVPDSAIIEIQWEDGEPIAFGPPAFITLRWEVETG